MANDDSPVREELWDSSSPGTSVRLARTQGDSCYASRLPGSGLSGPTRLAQPYYFAGHSLKHRLPATEHPRKDSSHNATSWFLDFDCTFLSQPVTHYIHR